MGYLGALREGVTGIGRKIASGGEVNVHAYMVNPETGEIEKVVKIPNTTGNLWQTKTREHAQKCIDTTKKYKIKTPEIKVSEFDTFVPEKGAPIETPVATEVDYIENIDQQILTMKELTDSGIGPKLLKQLMEMTKKMYAIRENENLGLDLVGSKMIPDGIKALAKAVILQATDKTPEIIRNAIHERFATYKGEINNLIVDKEGDLALADTGMHDFSQEGKIKWITGLANRYMSTVLIEVGHHANKRLPKDLQIPETEIDAIPCTGSRFDQALTRVLVNKVMITIDATLAREAKEKAAAAKNSPRQTDSSLRDGKAPPHFSPSSQAL